MIIEISINLYLVLIISLEWIHSCFSSDKIITFQTATTAKGRGVLRLLLLQQQMNIFCIPAICLQLFMITFPSSTMPLPLCVILEILFMTVVTNRSVSSLTVGLGRYSTIMRYLKMWGQHKKKSLILSGYSICVRMTCSHISKKKSFSLALHGFILHYLE